MSTENKWWAFVTDLLQGDTPADAERKSGINRSNFTRWKQGREVDPVMAVALTRKYDGNVLEALVACGLITETEAHLQKVGLEEALDAATDRQLVVAVLRKIEERDAAGEHTELDDPLDSSHPAVLEVWGQTPPVDTGRMAAQDGDVEREQEGSQETP